MWWIITLTVIFVLAGLLMLGLCKSAGDYDRSVEEAFERDMAAKNEEA
jgi:hypothetical protein